MKRVVIVAALWLASLTAHSQQWEDAGRSSKFTAQIDMASIRQQGPYLKAWIWNTYFEVQRSSGMTPYLSDRALFYFDCGSHTYAVKQRTTYVDPLAQEPGNSYAVSDSQLSFEDPVPGSMVDTYVGMACTKRKR